MYEIETKVLEVKKEDIENKLSELGAKLEQNIKLSVDWFGPKGLTHNGDDPWFLRVRSYNQEKFEVTWKGISKHLGASRQTKEINFTVSSLTQVSDLFEELDLEKYAHQEKFRKSWILNDWRFDMDIYPKIPPFVEIEAGSEESIQEAIKLLDLTENKTFNKGERMLAQEYGLNWFDMKF